MNYLVSVPHRVPESRKTEYLEKRQSVNEDEQRFAYLEI
jgi:hypothetical protein